MPLSAQPDHFTVFEQITTVQDAAQRWGYHESTIRYAINTGNIAAVKIGRDWIVSIPSMRAYYGSEIKDNILLHAG